MPTSKPQQFFRSNFDVVEARGPKTKGMKRVLRFVGSTEQVARDGMIIRAGAWETKAYERNPVVLWAHDYYGLPVGHTVHMERDVEAGTLTFDVQFLNRSESEHADTVYRLAKRGILRATSVGFIVKDTVDPNDDEKARGAHTVVTKAELLELSIVPVPADTDALIVGKGVGAGELKRELAAVRSWLADPYAGPPKKRQPGTRMASVRGLTQLVNEMQRALREKPKMTLDEIRRMLEETEVDFRADLRAEEDFDADSMEEAVYQEDPPVLLNAGVLTDEPDAGVVAQCIKFPKDAWEAEDAAAFLDANMDALLEWNGAAAPEGEEDEEVEEGDEETQAAEEEEADEGGAPTMEIPDEVLAQLDEQRKDELAQDAETLRAVAEALTASGETIMAIADDIDPASGEPSGEEPSGEEMPDEGEEPRGLVDVQDQTIRALAFAAQRLSAGTMGGVIRTMVEKAVEANTASLIDEIRQLREAVQRSRTVVTPAPRRGGRTQRPNARGKTPKGGGSRTYGTGLKALKDVSRGG